MPSLNAIAPDKLARLIGTPSCPVLIDVREDAALLVPGAISLRHDDVESWSETLTGPVITICQRGQEKSAGAAAWLRHRAVDAEILEGGIEAWMSANLPVIDSAKLPARDPQGRTRWVTRARPKVDRIACPWLIRRFVDPTAVFLFVAPSEVEGVARQLNAAPFDCEGVFWSHRGDQCTFDTMIEELGLTAFPALKHLAVIIRGADTARPELAPQSAGLVAAALGLSRMFADDLEQLDAGMLIYDAFYRWCRDAVDETHDWVSHSARPRRGN